MTHITEQELIEHYYGALDATAKLHLADCTLCRSAFEQYKETLDTIKEYPVPTRPADYGSAVWSGLQPKLPQADGQKHRWIWAVALAAVLAIAFLTPVIQKKPRPNRAGERALLLSLGDHLDRSEIVLTELTHADPKTDDLSREQELARELIDENRTLRQRAAQSGDLAHAVLLEDIERVLLEVANRPADVEALQHRIEDQSLLFKVRIVSVDAHRKGQTL